MSLQTLTIIKRMKYDPRICKVTLDIITMHCPLFHYPCSTQQNIGKQPLTLIKADE